MADDSGLYDWLKDVNILSQGDANIPDDRGLYAEGQSWLNEKHIIGRVIG